MAFSGAKAAERVVVCREGEEGQEALEKDNGQPKKAGGGTAP